jgi:hypothetical protein
VKILARKSSAAMVNCACGLLPNSARISFSSIWHDGALSIRNFMLKMIQIKYLNVVPWFHGHNPTKTLNFTTEHGGSLSIRNFKLMESQSNYPNSITAEIIFEDCPTSDLKFKNMFHNR